MTPIPTPNFISPQIMQGNSFYKRYRRSNTKQNYSSLFSVEGVQTVICDGSQDRP